MGSLTGALSARCPWTPSRLRRVKAWLTFVQVLPVHLVLPRRPRSGPVVQLRAGRLVRVRVHLLGKCLCESCPNSEANKSKGCACAGDVKSCT